MAPRKVLSTVFMMLALAVATLSATACTSTDGGSMSPGNSGSSSGSSGGY